MKAEASPTTPDPIEIAMEAEASDTAADSPARRLLVDQGRLVRWQIASERAGFALKVLTGAAGLAAALVLGATAWQASRASGVVIKPLSVPPALAQTGVTGEALASRLMDHLARIAEVARSSEQQRQVAAAGDGALSIEIPATGISLAQVDQWLRARLGHEQRVSGELSQEAAGLTLATRIAGHPLPVQTGAGADLDAMIRKTAEAIYARVQPRSWTLYLRRQNRWAELLEYGRREVTSADPRTRALGYLDMANGLQRTQGDAAAFAAAAKSVRLAPTPNGLYALSNSERTVGHDERAYQLKLAAVRSLADDPDFTAAGRHASESEWRGDAAHVSGDYPAALALYRTFSRTGNPGGSATAGFAAAPLAETLARLHDIQAARDSLEQLDDRGTRYDQGLYFVDLAAEDWAGALAAMQAVEAEARRAPDGGVLRPRIPAALARALVGLGRPAEAEALLAPTPLDCLPCVQSRALAAEARGDRAAADRWFAEAVRLAPSLPIANHDWGRALLARGDARGALSKFDAAHAQTPHFPDAIEGRGEALLALGDAHAAAAFAEAAKLAPKWGRVHLKWGEALARLGKAEEARAKWRAAAGMDLTAAERARLQALTGKRTL